MNKISETIGYARGMLKAMEGSNADPNLMELLGALVNGMEMQALNVRHMEEQLNELDEYVESIDDDLTELEYAMDGAAHEEDMDDDFDFDEDDEDLPLHLVKGKHTCRCGHHHDEDHECHCHEEGHECHCHDDDHECHCDDDDCDCEDEDFDEDEDMDLSGFDNLFLGVLCPACGHMFCVTEEDFDAPDALYHCPFCDKDVHVSPIDPNNVPVAKRVR